ncbi:MAG: hypothetical protein JXA46_11365 [Dehalococcoidales bacterium]|nr:hypothetical protein [Dehalococcoidales bacterium]
MAEYTHAKLNDEVHSIAGYYCPLKEDRIQYNGREVLYVLGQATVDNSCCANGCWEYAIVPGYIVRREYKTGADGLAVSEVEPIPEGEDRSAVSRIIKSSSGVNQVNFW